MVSNEVSILISETKHIHPVILKKNIWHLDIIHKEIKLYKVGEDGPPLLESSQVQCIWIYL